MSALNEFRKLTNHVKPELSSVTCPSLLIHSNADQLTLKENIEYVYDNILSKKKEKKILENTSHNIFVSSPSQQLIFEKVSSFLKKY